LGPVLLVRVVVKWAKGTPSPAEVTALRQLVPGLDVMPAGELLRALREAPEYEVGMFMPAKADEILTRGNELGLSVERR
jgi:hypothetical protein